jgi:hypothetical protein
MKPYALGLDETKTRCRITETRNKREKREVPLLKNMATMKRGTKDAPLNCGIKHKGKDT